MLTNSVIENKENPVRHYWLYILELRDGRLYVGITQRLDPYVRINEHLRGVGALYTQLNKVQRIHSIESLGYITKEEAQAIEHEITVKCMDIAGYNNVRGGNLTYSGNYVKSAGKLYRTHILHDHWA